MPHLVDGIAGGSLAAIALILWWPMTMDRLRRGQNQRAARQQGLHSRTQPQVSPDAHAEQAKALLAEWDKARLAKLN